MDDRELVAAICAHDPRGLAEAYAQYASPLYTFCRSMLGQRAPAEDALHDTFIILSERVAQLRQPERLRPWLYAIARSQCLRQLRAARRERPIDDSDDMSDETVELGSALESEQLRELVWAAVDGLNPNERAALELSLRHGLAGDDLADAMGVSRANAVKLTQRGREELERGLGVLLLTRGDVKCPQLAELSAGWDGQLTALMRKRLSRHIEHCPQCSTQRQRTVRASSLLAGVPFLAAPATLQTRVRHTLGLVSDDIAPAPASATTRPGPAQPPEPAAAESLRRARRAVARQAGPFDRDGFPTEHPRGLGLLTPIVAAAAAIAVGLILLVAPRNAAHDLSTRQLFGTVTQHSTSAAPSRSVRPSASSRAARPSASPTSKSSAPRRVILAPTPPRVASDPAPNTTVTPTRPPSHQPLVGPSTPGRPKPIVPPVSPGTLSLSSPKLDLGTDKSDPITLTVTGSPVTWTATTIQLGLSVSPSTATTASTQQVLVSVDRGQSKAPGSANVTFTWASGKTVLTVSWQ